MQFRLLTIVGYTLSLTSSSIFSRKQLTIHYCPCRQHSIISNLACVNHTLHVGDRQPLRDNLLSIVRLMLIIYSSIFPVDHMEFGVSTTVVRIEPSTFLQIIHSDTRPLSQLSPRSYTSVLARLNFATR